MKPRCFEDRITAQAAAQEIWDKWTDANQRPEFLQQNPSLSIRIGVHERPIGRDKAGIKTGFFLTTHNFTLDDDGSWRAHKEADYTDISAAAAALGSIRTEKKATASRNNGKLGGRPAGEEAEHMTGYHVYLYGEKFWHRTLDAAIRRATKATYCNNPQVIDVATGKLVYGNPE